MKIYQYFFQKLSKAFEKRYEIQAKGKRDKEPNLMVTNHRVNELFFVEKLRLYCAVLSYQIFSNQKISDYAIDDFLFIPEIIQIIKKDNSKWHPIIHIYMNLIEWFQELEIEPIRFPIILINLNNLEKQIGEQRIHLTLEEEIEIYSYMTNGLTTLLNFGNQSLLSIYIEYNQKIIELQQKSEELFIMDSGVYKNMTIALLRINQREGNFKKALQFVEKYQPNLQPQDKKYYHYCRAVVYFEMGRYKEAFEIVKILKRTKDMFLNFNIKTLQLQVYFEIEIISFQLLIESNIFFEKEIENFRGMLRHEREKKPKLSKGHFEYYEYFLKCYRILNDWYIDGGARNPSEDQMGKKRQLKQELANCDYWYKKWFEEKLIQTN